MSKDQTLYLAELKHIFSIVNDWLKFAESKNGALLAINSGIFLSFFSWLSENLDQLIPKAKIIILISIILLSISIVICILSFMPKLIITKNTPESSNNDPESIIFFKSISTYKNANIFLEDLIRKMDLKKVCVTEFEIDYANQIINNSKIALLKFQMFNAAVITTSASLFGILTMVVCCIALKII